MNVLSSDRLANALNRPDLAPSQAYGFQARIPVLTSDSGNSDLQAATAGTAPIQGRASLGILMGLIVFLVLSYAGTRTFQK